MPMTDKEIAELVKNAPSNVEEAVNRLYQDMRPLDIENWKSYKKDELINFHFNLGRHIRNEFGLWMGNDSLMKDTGETHADEASMVIIEKLWEKINAESTSESVDG